VTRLLALLIGICLSHCWGGSQDSPGGSERLFSTHHKNPLVLVREKVTLSAHHRLPCHGMGNFFLENQCFSGKKLPIPSQDSAISSERASFRQ